MTNTADLIKKYTELDNAQQMVEAWEVLQELKNLPPQISVEAVKGLREKYKPFIIWFDKVWNSLASWVVEEFINDLDILLS